MLVASVFAQQLTSTFDRRNLDETCLPCQDFYGYVNGGFLKQNPIPVAFSSSAVSAGRMLSSNSSLRLRAFEILFR